MKRIFLPLVFIVTILSFLPVYNGIVFAGTLEVQEQEPKFTYTTKPSEMLFIKKTPSVDKLISNATVGVTQGVDTNPLLDSSKKLDCYTQETLDMHFKYPLLASLLGFTNANFGTNITNMNYYKVTDVNIFDALTDVNLEQEIFNKFKLYVGYVSEILWFPRSADGNYVGNEINARIRQDINDRIYQRLSYRIIFRNYLERKIFLGNGNKGSPLRFDVRNILEHELGLYIIKTVKMRVTNQIYYNNSNDQYFDFYDFLNYRLGISATQMWTKKLYNITGFFYQRRNYTSRKVSDRDAVEHDNLYLVTTTFLYDLAKDLSLFINYSHSENHTNEPLEKFSDTLYTCGIYYSF